MIHEISHQLEAKGFEIVKPIKDSDGTTAYWMREDGENYVLAVKKYSYKGLASFMEGIVNKAAEHDITLLFYEDDTESLTVFDSIYYKNNAALSHGKSKKSDSRWLELSLTEGVSLEDYLSEADTPTTLAGDNATLSSYS